MGRIGLIWIIGYDGLMFFFYNLIKSKYGHYTQWNHCMVKYIFETTQFYSILIYLRCFWLFKHENCKWDNLITNWCYNYRNCLLEGTVWASALSCETTRVIISEESIHSSAHEYFLRIKEMFMSLMVLKRMNLFINT